MAEEKSNSEGSQKDGQTYFQELQKSFEEMNAHLAGELSGLQEQLNKRTTDWQDHLKNLTGASDMLYNNLNKQLDFHSRLDGIVEESQRRQIELQKYYTDKLGTFTYQGDKKKEPSNEPGTVMKPDEEVNGRRSILDRIRPI